MVDAYEVAKVVAAIVGDFGIATTLYRLGEQPGDACKSVLRRLEAVLPLCTEQESEVFALLSILLTSVQLETAKLRAGMTGLSKKEIVDTLNRTPCAKCGHLLQEHGVQACRVLTCPCRSWEPPRA